MINKEMLISRIDQLSEDDIVSLLNASNPMIMKNTVMRKLDCPYCGSCAVIRYGHKCGKQRFLCKHCGKTFVTTTHTIMSNSHFSINVWREIIKDTSEGKLIDHTARSRGCSHQAVFNMRHKVLMALQQLPEISEACLGDVSEFDETLVLDCYKGKVLEDFILREPRKHGAKAVKKGISNEYICICTGIQRKGAAIAAAVNRAKPNSIELTSIFQSHIADGTLALCDGLRSYHIFRRAAGLVI